MVFLDWIYDCGVNIEPEKMAKQVHDAYRLYRLSDDVGGPLPPGEEELSTRGAVRCLEQLRRRLIEVGASTEAKKVDHVISVIDGTLSDTEQNFIEALQQAGRRLSGEDLSIKAHGKYNGHSKGILTSLVKRGKITNRHDVKPTGYGLPHWS